ncbi:MAG: InlB B-repeat-containing protein, partial [Christensenellales bacterium]
MLLLTLALNACGKKSAPQEPDTYTVTFNGGGGVLISGDEVQTVEKGQGAVAPTYQRQGYTFDGWDKAFDNIQADITVTAKWKAETVTYT